MGKPSRTDAPSDFQEHLARLDKAGLLPPKAEAGVPLRSRAGGASSAAAGEQERLFKRFLESTQQGR